jgi:hypothetical protein
MPSDFTESGRLFEAALRVPELPISAIRSRSRARRMQDRSRLIVACALAVLATVGSGAVVAANMSGIRIWLSGNKAAVTMHSLATIANPNAEELRRVIASATFPVVLPVGLPAATRLNRVVFAPADHPNVIELAYGDGKSPLGLQFVLIDSSTIERGAIPPLAKSATVKQWNVGGETVIMARRFSGQAAIEAAMTRATPSGSFAQTLPALYRITILDDLSDRSRYDRSAGWAKRPHRSRTSQRRRRIGSRAQAILVRSNGNRREHSAGPDGQGGCRSWECVASYRQNARGSGRRRARNRGGTRDESMWNRSRVYVRGSLQRTERTTVSGLGAAAPLASDPRKV